MECFIMITQLDDHWDKIPNSKTSFKEDLIFSKNLLRKLKDRDLMNTKFYEKITTYFVKVSKYNKNGQRIEHIYEGHISDIEYKGKKIFFKVNLKREINKDEYTSYPCLVNILRSEYYSIGWYYRKEYSLLPSFFEVLKETDDPYEFEDLTYYLLKLIGINHIHRYDKRKQRGRPDGIFKIGNLVVVYDATLLEPKDWDKEKQEQILNYMNKLNDDKIGIFRKTFWSVKNFSKRVWIITRYKVENYEFEQLDNIKVRAITIDDLFKIYEERLKEINDEETLKRRLEDL